MKLSAVLLAGGESSRMGRDKATLFFNRQPLWRHQIELLRSLVPMEIFVSARTDPSWRPSETVFVADVPPSRGPLSGLIATMTRMQGTHLLALAVDMPLMSRSHLEGVCSLVETGHGVLPKIGARAEPMAAIYPRESLPHLLKALNSSDVSLQHATAELVQLGLLSVILVSPEETQLYRNFNAPEDIASIQTAEI